MITTVQKPRKARLNLRAQAIQLIHQVQQGQSLSAVLPAALDKTAERDRALLNELVNGTLRYWFTLRHGIQPLLSKPLKDDVVEAALYLGAYQLLQTRIPPHAALGETVEAVKQLGKVPAAGLVNAILRRLHREQEIIATTLATHHGLPDWLARQLKTDWPTQFDALASALQQAAPLFLRANQRQIARDGYLEQLAQAEIEAVATTLPDGIQLTQSARVTALPGFASGWFSVQDENAQRCASLLGDLTGKTVLDACAAPGGKTAHLLEKYDVARMVALDHDGKRLQRVRDNLVRLQLLHQPVDLIEADATCWQAKEPFDAILLDAPCTATGVLRRHPDIRLLRQPQDVVQTVQLQAKLLKHLWTLLAPGGHLLYVTCSLLKAENEQQIQAFLQQTPDAQAVPIKGEWGEARPVGRQCFPKADGGDGFYFALLCKS